MPAMQLRNALDVRRGVALAVLAWTAITGCNVGTVTHVFEPPTQPPSVPDDGPSRGLLAGVAEIDITPGLGAPLFGYSWDADRHASGVWTRLKARVIALDDQKGERLALVQVDLGAMSGFVHRQVAADTSRIGITADRLLIAATHTHGAPGGYFGEPFFNDFGSGRPGYDPSVAGHFVTTISAAVHRAFAHLEPAALRATEIRLPGITHNRSIAARTGNPSVNSSTPDLVDSSLRLLRVDRIDERLASSPLAALFVFAIHGTAMPHSNTVYHGDLHAVAMRAFAGLVRRDYGVKGEFVAAFMNGAEGDVAPCPDHPSLDARCVPLPSAPWKLPACARIEKTICQAKLAVARREPNARPFTVSDRSTSTGEALAIELGEHIARGAYQAYRSLGAPGTVMAGAERSPLLRHAYREVTLPGLLTSSGTVCSTAMIGVATMGGAEDGRSGWYGSHGVYEGNRRNHAPNDYCQGSKKPAAGFIQSLLLTEEVGPGHSVPHFLTGTSPPASFPRIAPFQVLQIGRSMLLGTVPGEPTTEVGRRILVAMEAASSRPKDAERIARPVTAVVGVANEYLYYFTTPAEFDAQHYEGASTLYGPLSGVAVTEQLEAAAAALGKPDADRYPKERAFWPGRDSQLQARGRCDTLRWRLYEFDTLPPGYSEGLPDDTYVPLNHPDVLPNDTPEILRRVPNALSDDPSILRNRPGKPPQRVGEFLRVLFWGPGRDQNCGRFPSARIVCDAETQVSARRRRCGLSPSSCIARDAEPLRSADGQLEDDEGYRIVLFRVPVTEWRKGSDAALWEARWRVPRSREGRPRHCWMEIARSEHDYFSSPEFEL